jgi:hypothetical protein
VTLRIAKLELERIGTDQKEKYALYFKGCNKQFVVSPTCWDQIVDICGSAESDDWIGQDITLFRDKTPFGGKMVDCIRVRKPPEPRLQMTQARPPQNRLPQTRQPAMAKPTQPEPPPHDDIPDGPAEDDTDDYDYR